MLSAVFFDCAIIIRKRKASVTIVKINEPVKLCLAPRHVNLGHHIIRRIYLFEIFVAPKCSHSVGPMSDLMINGRETVPDPFQPVRSKVSFYLARVDLI